MAATKTPAATSEQLELLTEIGDIDAAFTKRPTLLVVVGPLVSATPIGGHVVETVRAGRAQGKLVGLAPELVGKGETQPLSR